MSESSNKLECLVLDKLSELQKKVCRLFGFTINPEIAFDLKGQAAGQANYLKNKIRFNRDLLEKFTDEFVSQTVPHEFAHLVDLFDGMIDGIPLLEGDRKGWAMAFSKVMVGSSKRAA